MTHRAPVRVGVDIGGTNTDVVAMRGDELLASSKEPTTPDVTDGIIAGITRALARSGVDVTAVAAVMVGTTQFTNALVERRRLAPTAVVRACLPANTAIPPYADWPTDLVASLGGVHHMVHGGVEYSGRPLARVEPSEIDRVAADLIRRGITSVAVSSTFSPMSTATEDEVADLLEERVPHVDITKSSTVGRIGFIERENSAAVNASLRILARHIVGSIENALDALGFRGRLYISQNDGTVMSADRARAFPILTVASGPANSIRGAAYLSGLDSAVVIDIGGTTMDAGFLVKGLPRQAGTEAEIGGVRVNYRMPDVLSVGIGGGSIVRQGASGTEVGPGSVGFALTEQALIFGGRVLTATDVAVAAGDLVLGDPTRVAAVPALVVTEAQALIRAALFRLAARMSTSAECVPIVLVGGGSVIVGSDPGAEWEFRTPAHANVANAIGAAMAQVSGEVDRIYLLDGSSREERLLVARRQATRLAIEAGASTGTVEIAEIEEIPTHLPPPGSGVRVQVKAVGALELQDMS